MDPALDRFRQHVLADPALQADLLAEADPTRFAVRVVTEAHRAGIDVAVATVLAELAAARDRWLTRWVVGAGGSGAPETDAPRPDPPRSRWDDAADWTPWQISPGPQGPVVEWCHTGGLAFDDPFFDQTLQRACRHPFRLLFTARTALATIADDVARAPALPIAGVVLHMSRCGSTLVAQVLDALPRLLVISEPPVVDVALRLARAAVPLPDGSVVGATHVRAVVDALARPRHPAQEACVLKLDAWSVVDLPFLRRALPGVPWVFCHREGAAVLASQRRMRGPHVLPGGLAGPWGGWDPGIEPDVDLDERAARTLAGLAAAALDHRGPDGVFVDHADLPGAVADVVAPHFGLDLTPADREAMAAAGRRDAKNPVIDHELPPPPPADLVALAARWLDPVRDRLHELSRR